MNQYSLTKQKLIIPVIFTVGLVLSLASAVAVKAQQICNYEGVWDTHNHFFNVLTCSQSGSTVHCDSDAVDSDGVLLGATIDGEVAADGNVYGEYYRDEWNSGKVTLNHGDNWIGIVTESGGTWSGDRVGQQCDSTAPSNNDNDDSYDDDDDLDCNARCRPAICEDGFSYDNTGCDIDNCYYDDHEPEYCEAGCNQDTGHCNDPIEEDLDCNARCRPAICEDGFSYDNTGCDIDNCYYDDHEPEYCEAGCEEAVGLCSAEIPPTANCQDRSCESHFCGDGDEKGLSGTLQVGVLDKETDTCTINSPDIGSFPCSNQAADDTEFYACDYEDDYCAYGFAKVCPADCNPQTGLCNPYDDPSLANCMDGSCEQKTCEEGISYTTQIGKMDPQTNTCYINSPQISSFTCGKQASDDSEYYDCFATLNECAYGFAVTCPAGCDEQTGQCNPEAELKLDVIALMLDDFLADGESTADILATVTDAQGNSMPDRSLEFSVLTADGSAWGEITPQSSTDETGTANVTLTAGKRPPGELTSQEPLMVTVIAKDTATGIEGKTQINVNHYYPKVDYYPKLPTCADCSPYPITITLVDANDIPVAGVSVTAELQSGSGELMVDPYAGAGTNQISAETGSNGVSTLYLKPSIPDLSSESSLSILVYEAKTSGSATLQIEVEPLDIALTKVEQVAYTGITHANAFFYIHLRDLLHRDAPLDRFGLEKDSPIKYMVQIKQTQSDGSAVSQDYLETTYLAKIESGGYVLRDYNNNPPTPHVVPVNDGVTFYSVRVDAIDSESGNPIYDPYLKNNDTIIAVQTGSPDGWLHTFLMNGVLTPSNHTGALIKCAASFLPGLGDVLTLIDALNEGYRLKQSVQGNEWDLYALGQKLAEAAAGDAADAAGLSSTAAVRVGVAGKIANCIKDHAILMLQNQGQATGALRSGGTLCMPMYRTGSQQGTIGEFNDTFDPFFHGFITDLDGYEGVIVMTPPGGSAEILDESQAPVNSSLKTVENGVSLFLLPAGQGHSLQFNSPGSVNVSIYEPGGEMNRSTITHYSEQTTAISGQINLSPGSDYALRLDTNGDGQVDETINPQITQMDTSRPTVTMTSPMDQTGSNATIKATFQDQGGSGIDPSSFKIVVDTVDLTNSADITATGISIAVSNLPAGTHQVVVGVQDGDGNAALAEWSFQSIEDSSPAVPPGPVSYTSDFPFGLVAAILGVGLCGAGGLAGVVLFVRRRKKGKEPAAQQQHVLPQSNVQTPQQTHQIPTTPPKRAPHDVPGSTEAATIVDATVADVTLADATVADATIADATVPDIPPILTWQLIMQQGPLDGFSFPLSEGDIRIGRDSKNDITIPHSGVSSSHARLVRQGDAYQLEDLDSTNGTFVNGQRLDAPRMLQEGDVVKFGKEIACIVSNFLEAPAGSFSEAGISETIKPSLKTCPNCGVQLPSTKSFCTNCGQKQ
jgi:hypothetical protein